MSPSDFSLKLKKLCSEAFLGSLGAIIGFILGKWRVSDQLKQELGAESFKSVEWTDIWINSSSNSFVLNYMILCGAIGVVLASAIKVLNNEDSEKE